MWMMLDESWDLVLAEYEVGLRFELVERRVVQNRETAGKSAVVAGKVRSGDGRVCATPDRWKWVLILGMVRFQLCSRFLIFGEGSW